MLQGGASSWFCIAAYGADAIGAAAGFGAGLKAVGLRSG